MLESKASQFFLSVEGNILWQEKLNSPLPGVTIATLEKGEHALKPIVKVLENEKTAKIDKAALKNHLNIWMNTHLSAVLEPLVLLEVPQGVDVKEDPVSRIAAKIYDGLGIVPRGDLEDLISQLTPETRADLRAKKIRLGPILAFIPALNKPAAVKLRALLWSLFNGCTLPAKVPADGIVSTKIGEEHPNEEFFRAIGYPLYGGRAVRIDMLDRVINCVYDNAQGGKFQARHEMAEWLGCPIDDLYKVLEAMGHTKIFDPAEKAEEEAEIKAGALEKTALEVEKTSHEKTDEKLDIQDENDKSIKPELATFRLKKGKASQKGAVGGVKAKSKKKEFGSGVSKPSDKEKNKKLKKKKDQAKRPKRDNGPRVISVEAKVNEDDSPFAILQQLKK